MSGITDLDELLRSMRPKLMPTEFVFCTTSGALTDYVNLEPVASRLSNQKVSLWSLKSLEPRKVGLAFEGIYQQITLTVHSSLDAVGLTAAVASKLASKGISANVIAAYYHDHIFVQQDKATAALLALEEFSTE